MATLVLVESPSKAKKIAQLLGRGYTVKATIGHICDLPQKEYGVNLETFEEAYEVRKQDVVAQIRKLAKDHDEVIIASDPDREGECIAWHVARELKLPLKTTKRATYGEITEAIIRTAIANPRTIDLQKVDAARSRRVLDRIIGFDVSREICWPAGAQSAGRVQTPALHILCQLERQIRSFTALTYWVVSTTYGEGFTAYVIDSAKPAPPSASGEGSPDEADDAKERTGRLTPRRFLDKAEAETLVATAKAHPHVVRDVQKRRAERKPEPPYTTSTLQQDASRKLRLSAKQAMDQAQQLFEAGYITYHRTDSTRLSDDAIAMARAAIGNEHPEVLPAQPPRYRTKAGAQDGHEAIRPSHLEGHDAPPPGTEALYALIRARFLASQCKPAAYERTTVRVESGPVEWVAEGAVMLERGYLVYWGPYAKTDDELLPPVQQGQSLTPTAFNVTEKKTAPPSRFDEGSFIKKLETSGVGRPSTFAMIVDTLQKRNYVEVVTAGKGKKVLQPTEFGLAVDALLAETFPALVEEQYTADMESQLDAIESGDTTRVAYLRGWHQTFRTEMTAALPRGEAYRRQHNLHAPARGAHGGEDTGKTCDRCGDATYRKITRKGGKGSFLACPNCQLTRDVQAKVKPAGCPKCGSALIERRSAKDKSKFFGCVRYGAAERPCNYIEGSDGKARGRFTRTLTEKTCPKCTKTKLAHVAPSDTSEGPGFYACDDRTCGFILPVGMRRRKEACPLCAGVVVERHRKQSAEDKAAGTQPEAFWSCARYPDCKWAGPMAPVAPVPAQTA